MRIFDNERAALVKDQKLWIEEKKRIAEISPIKDIVQLSLSGKKYDVLRSTLCHVEGSALEAMFSGRHELKMTDDGRVFIDRNPKPFMQMIDFIRNGG